MDDNYKELGIGVYENAINKTNIEKVL